MLDVPKLPVIALGLDAPIPEFVWFCFALCPGTKRIDVVNYVELNVTSGQYSFASSWKNL